MRKHPRSTEEEEEEEEEVSLGRNGHMSLLEGKKWELA